MPRRLSTWPHMNHQGSHRPVLPRRQARVISQPVRPSTTLILDMTVCMTVTGRQPLGTINEALSMMTMSIARGKHGMMFCCILL